jgi:hypothetical protein
LKGAWFQPLKLKCDISWFQSLCFQVGRFVPLHSGFNTGYNCAESCNFGTDSWVEIGEDARPCECVPDTVRLDMSIFDDNVCGRVDEDDYTAVKRARVGVPQKRPPGERHKEAGLALFTTLFCSQNTVQLMTASMVHV